MKLKVNGEERMVDAEQVSVAEALKLFEVESPDMVSVQLNQEFMERETFETPLLKEGDELEFLYFMGGGAF